MYEEKDVCDLVFSFNIIYTAGCAIAVQLAIGFWLAHFYIKCVSQWIHRMNANARIMHANNGSLILFKPQSKAFIAFSFYHFRFLSDSFTYFFTRVHPLH